MYFKLGELLSDDILEHELSQMSREYGALRDHQAVVTRVGVRTTIGTAGRCERLLDRIEAFTIELQRRQGPGQ